jgi:hypothetical protein
MVEKTISRNGMIRSVNSIAVAPSRARPNSRTRRKAAHSHEYSSPRLCRREFLNAMPHPNHAGLKHGVGIHQDNLKEY